nr:RNA-directed DNA polymerase, eukaryota [Tanacetum cinerariifolium]
MHRKRSMEVLVLDDSCVAERDLSNHVMGNVKDVSSISNFRTLIMDEGFSVVNLVYLGGLWVMIECDNVETKANMLQHIGVKSWFHVLQNAINDFGEALDIEDNVDSSFGRKVFMVRAKELFIWNLIFLGQNENEYTLDEDSDVGLQKVRDRSQFCEEGPNDDRKQQFEDPFNIYRLLRKQPGDESHEVSSSLSHPPGFTPNVLVIQNENGQSAKEILVVVNAKVMNNSQDVYKEASCDNVDPNVVKKGGSVLGVMEDMIRVGKAMCYLMDGYVKDLEQIIGTQGVGDAVGNSGGILCVWEATLFKKDYATISDNLVAIYGTWLPSNSKNGEVVVLGDFNEVWNIDERHGSCFNPTSARVFDQFISASGLVNVKMEGYTFTWSHPSGSKMNKLDRFLVSKGIFSIFPSITAVCLDRHLSDHHPIILYEVQVDFGPIPVQFYHSWISLEGFDAMDLKVRIQAWIKDKRLSVSGEKDSIKKELSDIDRLLDGGDVSDSNLLCKRLSDVQASDLERRVSRDEIRLAVWNCGENKSPGLDGSVYKVVTNVLANWLALVISDLISDTQFAFVANKHNLDGSFILNELLHWCKRKKKQVMSFKLDFAKAYDSSAKASVLVNGSPTIEFPIHCGLKQGDPLSPYLFILIIESLNMSFTRAIDEGVFKGVHLHGSTSISHLFYADDVVFIVEWSDDNMKGVGIPSSILMQATSLIGCGVLHKQFRYLGVMVGECMSRHNAWASTVDKLRSCLSKWKVKTLSVCGRLTLLKADLGASPLYNLSIFKVRKGILNSMEAIRSMCFNGMEPSTNKITCAWNKVLASKENGGLGVSSYHALNHALLLKWVWRFISQYGSLWFRVMKALYRTSIDSHPVNL